MRRLSVLVASVLTASAIVVNGTNPPASAGPAQPGEVIASAVWQCDVGPGWCVSTTARVNLRTGPHLGDGIVMTMFKGARFAPECWVWGESVNGDLIWYWGTHRLSIDVSPVSWERGYVAGYYLATGKDPHPYFNNCVDS